MHVHAAQAGKGASRTTLVLRISMAATLASAWAQDIRMPVALDKLAAKAVESVDVTLDGNLLQLAGKFLSDKDADQAKAKKLITGLRGISVRSLTFATPGSALIRSRCSPNPATTSRISWPSCSAL